MCGLGSEAQGLDRAVRWFRGFRHLTGALCQRISLQHLVSAGPCHLAQTTPSQGRLMGLKPAVDPRDPGRAVSLWKEPVAFGRQQSRAESLVCEPPTSLSVPRSASVTESPDLGQCWAH